jgi:hypothetical protein
MDGVPEFPPSSSLPPPSVNPPLLDVYFPGRDAAGDDVAPSHAHGLGYAGRGEEAPPEELTIHAAPLGPSEPDAVFLSARRGLARSFRSGGVIEDVSAALVSAPRGGAAGGEPSTSQPAAASASASASAGGTGARKPPPPRGTLRLTSAPIGRGNIGYSLLQKAGWVEGKGIGAREQGIVEPLDPFANPGRKGVGAAAVEHSGRGRRRGQTGDEAGDRGESASRTAPAGGGVSAAAAAAGGGRGGIGTGGGGATAGTRAAQKRALAAAQGPPEDLDTKVKRHKQLQQQEEEDEKYKAIGRYLSGALRDEGPGDRGNDTNPLLRRSKLTDSNPLLNSW